MLCPPPQGRLVPIAEIGARARAADAFNSGSLRWSAGGAVVPNGERR